MTSSLEKSTISQYNSVLRPWCNFCKIKNYNGYNPEVSQVLEFLTKKFHEKATYGTLNSARSAISLVSNKKIGEDDSISRFMKGVSKLHPPKPKYVFTWDVTIVLDYLETLYPLETISFTNITYKTMMLMILSTAHRAQIIAKIRLDNIQVNEDGILIHITDRIKTSAPGRYQLLLSIPFCSQFPKNCVATALKVYLEKSKDLRKDSSKLFVAIKRPHKDIGAQTISRWVKLILGMIGIDLNKFTAHSTRHSATSKAKANSIDLDTIKRTAGWTTRSETFAKFYNRPIIPLNTHDFSIIIH
ncbi:hypothetical protein TSAR_016214 [Trichomalopsis sarcophagae]|uniref:Tyr recombinase domain-containing protein n=1 Tax=Trichomalopsis sarcophagae TaxID=543379 RepID=A0A232ERI6_9HYME|nr:hypothetical protein TSAR_016214 [Trichomalopsis sarcophagae]